MVLEFRISPYLVIPMKLAILNTQKHFRPHMYFKIQISIAYLIYPSIPYWKQWDNWIPLSVQIIPVILLFLLLYLAIFSEICFTLGGELLPLEQLLEGLKVHSGKEWFKSRFLRVNGLFLPLYKRVEHRFSYPASDQWYLILSLTAASYGCIWQKHNEQLNTHEPVENFPLALATMELTYLDFKVWGFYALNIVGHSSVCWPCIF